MELKLKEFSSFCNLVSLPVVLFSMEQKKIVVVNDIAEELFGYSADELYSIDVFKLFAAQNRKNIEALIEICAANTVGFKIKESDLFIRRKTGRRSPVELSCSLLEVSNEKFILMNLIDVSALVSKQVEKESLIQDNLRISKLADLSRLATGMAHELNNPLAILSGYAEHLERVLNDETKTFEDAKKSLKPIRNNVARMTNIISKLMKMFRSEEIQFCTVSVRRLINLALSTIKNQIDNTNIIISVEIEDLNINCDILYTEQVVINILNNAITALNKFSDLRLIRIKTSESAEEICISINNNGAPIPENYRDKIFTPFFTTKQVGEGVGLGLYLAQNIMRIHDGKITLETNSKIGTTFNLIFPKRSAILSGVHKIRKSVMVISEDLNLRKNCHDLLNKAGLKVFEARDFSESSSISMVNVIDSYILDIDVKMDNDFWTLSEFIASNHNRPVIIFSNDLNHPELKKIEKTNNVYIFSNHLTLDEFKDVILVIEQFNAIKELKSA